MTTNTKLAALEVALYAVAVWASIHMAKTDDQRRTDRLKRYRRTAHACWWLAYELGQAGIRAELAYMEEVST